MTTNTKPPIEIYMVLHEFECLGGQLPKIVDKWWLLETKLNERNKNGRK